MLTVEIDRQTTSTIPPVTQGSEKLCWYAIHTRSRHEKHVAHQLQESRIFIFLPLIQQMHRWSDRQSRVEVPMFPCYAFVRIAQSPEERLAILRTAGVLGFVGNERHGTQIPDFQIDNLKKAIGEKVSCSPHPFVDVGKRVRVRGGSLDGVEGIVIRQGRDQRLIISVELLQRSVSIQFEGYDIELV